MKVQSIYIAPILIVLSACKPGVEVGIDEKTREEIASTRATLESLATKLDQTLTKASENAVTAADAVDPLGQKMDRRTIEELRNTVDLLKNQLAVGPSGGIIEFGNQQIELLATASVPGVTLDANIVFPDGSSQPILIKSAVGQLSKTAIVSDFPNFASSQIDDQVNAFKNGQVGERMGPNEIEHTKEWIWRKIKDGTLNGWYTTEFINRYQRALDQDPSIRGSSPEPVKFRDLLNGSGQRIIELLVVSKPEGDFRVNFQLALRAKDGEKNTILEGTLDAKHTEVKVPIRVKFSSDRKTDEAK